MMRASISRFHAPPRPPGPIPFRFRRSRRRLPVHAALVGFILLLSASPATPSQEWLEPTGDVSLPNADIVCSAAVVEGGTVHLIARFADIPLRGATHEFHWWIDADRDPTTTGRYFHRLPGADVVVGFSRSFGYVPRIFVQGDVPERDLSVGLHSNYIATGSIVHVFFPLEFLEDDGDFGYFMDSHFGGSFGANERAPDLPSFATPGGHYSSAFGSFEACGIVLPGVPTPPERIEALFDYLDLLAEKQYVAASETAQVRQLLSSAQRSLVRGDGIGAIRHLESAVKQVPIDENDGFPIFVWGGAGYHITDQIQATVEAIVSGIPAGRAPNRESDQVPRRGLRRNARR
jgi:hypothetical protein